MMENNKTKKKFYQSTKDYSKKYNHENINIQLNRELISKLKQSLDGVPIKHFIEKLINDKLSSL